MHDQPEKTDVVPSARDTLPPMASPPQLIGGEVTVTQAALLEPEHHRIGGKAGVRVHHESVGVVTQVKRVNGGNDDGPLGLMTTVPAAVLLSVHDTLSDRNVTPIEARQLVRELLAPWFPAR